MDQTPKEERGGPNVPNVGLVKVNLPNGIHRQAKAAAALAGTPLGEWMKAAVEVALEHPESVVAKLPENEQ
jgi:hypothetical protein